MSTNMFITEKLKIEIEARKKAGEIMSEFSLSGLSHYVKELTNILNDWVGQIEKTAKELKKSDFTDPFEPVA